MKKLAARLILFCLALALTGSVVYVLTDQYGWAKALVISAGIIGGATTLTALLGWALDNC